MGFAGGCGAAAGRPVLCRCCRARAPQCMGEPSRRQHWRNRLFRCRMTPEDLDPIEIIRSEAKAMAQCFGVPAPDEAAASLVARVQARLAGITVYIPARSSQDRKLARDQIVSRFDGRNAAKLALEFNTTTRNVRRILEKARHEHLVKPPSGPLT
ncbi:MAG: hypothetical protein EOO27_04725 [Comamonadaceae bacterium]|nr:MAG: hypothetical protein EOO27_04725 [Comamonadaceae bacterium]